MNGAPGFLGLALVHRFDSVREPGRVLKLLPAVGCIHYLLGVSCIVFDVGHEKQFSAMLEDSMDGFNHPRL